MAVGHSLDGKPVGTVLLEYLGPVQGRNYDGTSARTVTIKVRGAGAVQLQENLVTDILSEGVTPNPIGFQRRPDQTPANWNNVGAAVNQAAGTTTSPALTGPDQNLKWVRVIVDTTGDGDFFLTNDWLGA